MKLVLDFKKENIGSKAYNLVQLHESGLNVPPFIIFEFDFFKEETTKTYLAEKQKELENRNVHLRKLSDELRDWADDAFGRENKSEFMTYLESMSETDEFSVRSSASVEDSHRSSFAGQFTTILNVRKSHMLNEVKLVLKSMYRESVLNYLRERNVSLVDLQMNVIIQSMIPGELSGIYFTANPKGLMNQHIVVLGEGVGANVVEDKVATTTVTIHPDDNIHYYEKTGDSPILDDAARRKVRQMVEIITDRFGTAMDIEFTFYEGRLYVLQVRPITSLPEGERIILDNSNIVESYPGVTAPLSATFVQAVYHRIMSNLAKRLLGNEVKTLAAYEETFSNMVATVNSRLYYQINNWYKLLQLLPFSERVIANWQDMLGVTHTEVPETPINITKRQRTKIMWRGIREFVKAPRNMARLETDFQKIQTIYYNRFSNELTYAELWELFDDLLDSVMAKWDVTLMNDLNAFIYTGLLKRISSPDKAQAAIAGITQIESMRPVQMLHAIVERLQAESNQTLKAKLMSLEGEEAVWEFLAEEQEPLVLEIRRFISLYGDRAPEELKLETKTFRTHPELFINLLKQMLADEHLTESEALDVKTMPEMNRPLARWLRQKAILGIRNRETSRLNRTRLYGMARSIFVAIAELLVEDGKLNQIEDVFYIRLDELRLLSLDDNMTIDEDSLQERQEELTANKELPAYSRLEFVGNIFESYPQNAQFANRMENTSNTLQGIGCSAGKVEGEVLVVDDIQTVEANTATDKIIVTKMTDPGWVYLLTRAKGIITEKGSLLSHTAIVSRELGIPAVVNVANVMNMLEDGDKVEIDGQSGRITRLEKEL